MATKLFEFINFLYIFPYCPGWEYSSGLHYKKVNETHTDLHSTCLISPPDFFIPSAAGMHYCDLLSPFRCHQLSHRYILFKPSSGPLSGSILWGSRESPCSSYYIQKSHVNVNM